jgi:hypothetical protein
MAIQFVIAAMPAADLGMTVGTMVWIDQNAAGHGWYTDGSPNSAAGFTDSGGRVQAVAGGLASGRMDLLTVVEHELGHVLGLPDTAGPGLMNEWLSPGTRRLPSLDLVLPGAGLEGGEQGLQTLVSPDTRASGPSALVAILGIVGIDDPLARVGGGSPVEEPWATQLGTTGREPAILVGSDGQDIVLAGRDGAPGGRRDLLLVGGFGDGQWQSDSVLGASQSGARATVPDAFGQDVGIAAIDLVFSSPDELGDIV